MLWQSTTLPVSIGGDLVVSDFNISIMKVPTLCLYSSFIAIDINGKQTEVSDRIIAGCWNMCQHLEKSFGIKTVPSTVYAGKKIFTPTIFPCGKTKEYYLAYLNWVINFPRSERADFFENEPDMNKFYLNNPIVDVKMRVSKDNHR